MTKRVLIVTALAGFVRSFLMSDIATLQDLGYEVHCAANANHVGADDVLLYLQKHNVHYHQIDFSSNKPLSFKTIKSFYQFWSLVRKNHFEYVHCHTPIAGAICRIILRKQQRKKQVKIIYTTHGFYFHKLSSRKTWLVFYNIENLLSRWTNVIITINKEDFNNAKKMYCKDVRYIPGVGVDLDRFHNVTIDISDYRSSLGLRDEDFVVLAIGEISQRKNQKVVIKALAKAKIPNSVLLICGADMAGGATKQELEYTANKNNVRVQFLGLRKDIP